MSIQAIAAAMRLDLPPLTKWLLVCLAEHATPEGRRVAVSIETLGRQTGMSERAVRRNLRSLEDDGVIAEETDPEVIDAIRKIIRADRLPNVYRLPFCSGEIAALPRGATNAPRKPSRGATNDIHGGPQWPPNRSTEPGTGVRPSATQTGAAAPKARATTPGRAVVRAVLDHCRRHSIPEPDQLARTALGQQALNLLHGGYDERDIREVALELAGRFTLYDRHKALMTLQSTVLQRCADPDYAEHVERKEGSRVVAPDVAAAIGPLAHVPLRPGSHDPRDDSRWSTRCAAGGCRRIALHGLAHCADHEPREAQSAG